MAANNNHIDCVRFLVESNADLSARDHKGQTASIVSFHCIRIKLFWAHFAARFGKIDALKVLVELGADVSILDNNGDSPCKLFVFEYIQCGILSDFGRREWKNVMCDILERMHCEKSDNRFFLNFLLKWFLRRTKNWKTRNPR